MKVRIETLRYQVHTPLKIARGTLNSVEAVAVTLEADGHIGRGEGVGVRYLGESAALMAEQLEAVRDHIEEGFTVEGVQAVLMRGGARNALDAATWDLEAKRAGVRAWELAGVSDPGKVPVVATIGLDEPEVMAAEARVAPVHAALKIKLGRAQDDVERIRCVRRVSPTSRILADANEGWTFDELRELAPELAHLGVELIEQPLPRGQDEALEGWHSPVPLCADESCQDRADLSDVRRRYALINIKLDKAGGLTEALATAAAARAIGLPYMVGCMMESSLGLAPAVVLARDAVWRDLDGPRFLAEDREPRLVYRDGRLSPPQRELWG